MTRLKHTLIILIFFSFSFKFGLSQDTVVSGVNYNFIDYYRNGKIKILGQLDLIKNKPADSINFTSPKQKDSIKNGQWIYFKPNGGVLAKGNFTAGVKMGNWQYTNYFGRKRIIDFSNSYTGQSQYVYIKHHRLYIKDSWFRTSHCRRVYKNGKFIKEYCFDP